MARHTETRAALAEARALPAAVGALSRAPATRGVRAAQKLVDKAIACLNGGDAAGAVREAIQASRVDPDAVAAYVVAGLGLDRLGRLPEALRFFEEAVRRAPGEPATLILLGEVAQRHGDLPLAERWFRAAVRVAPQRAEAVAGLAICLRDQGRFDDAMEIVRAALYADPTAAGLWNALGAVLIERGDAPEAETFLREAVRLDPALADAHHNLGLVLIDAGRFAEAADVLETAGVRAAAREARARSLQARAMALMGAGRVADGLAAHEARFDPHLPNRTLFEIAGRRWMGEPLAEHRLLLVGEQGLGDEVFLMRAAFLAVEALGAEDRLAIACEPRLASLFQRSFPLATVVGHATRPLGPAKVRSVPGLTEPVDLWAPMGDVAVRLGAERAPASPALRPDPARVAALRAQLAAFGPGPHVGLAWRSLLMNANRSRFFAEIGHWGAALRGLDCTFVSLQPGDSAAERARLEKDFGVRVRLLDGLDLKDDLDGVAAAAAALDLVLGPMNAANNIAASVGAPVWFVEGYRSWTMFGANAAIPWYPQARVLVADEAGGWSALFPTLRAALQSWCAERASTAA